MASKTQRTAIVVVAFTFLITSLAFSGLVLWQMFAGNSQTTNNTGQLDQSGPSEGALEGTQLANYEPVDSVSELQVIDLQEGTGEEVRPNATVTAHYTGALAQSGIIFQSSHDVGQPATFALNEVIAGWREGVVGMKTDGVRRLIIPAEQAYGESSPSPNIPPNSDLVFDIELVEVE